jgi:hypothetical protein
MQRTANGCSDASSHQFPIATASWIRFDENSTIVRIVSLIALLGALSLGVTLLIDAATSAMTAFAPHYAFYSLP